MFYKDGFDLDSRERVILCPNCSNEEFSDKACHCRICGIELYNFCEGYYDNDLQEHIKHKNPGNARFCEICGAPTYFFKENFLKKWEDAKKEIEPNLSDGTNDYFTTANEEVATTNNNLDSSSDFDYNSYQYNNDDDIPF